MEFSFGIITNNNYSCLEKIIESINNQKIEKYEIIIVGARKKKYLKQNNISFIEFDETQHTDLPIEHKKYRGWITRKKNIITENAKYENIVFMHDYVILDKNWYKGYLKYGNNFDIIINKIKNTDNTRFRDWTINLKLLEKVIKPKLLNKLKKKRVFLLDYDNNNKILQKYIYYSGTYWIAKKHVMEKFPLNEKKLHRQGEDCEWSDRVRNKYEFKFNKHSICRLIKYKEEAKNDKIFTYNIYDENK